jgi:Co/Zn/Cd efflux system component
VQFNEGAEVTQHHTHSSAQDDTSGNLRLAFFLNLGFRLLECEMYLPSVSMSMVSGLERL